MHINKSMSSFLPFSIIEYLNELIRDGRGSKDANVSKQESYQIRWCVIAQRIQHLDIFFRQAK